MNLNIHQHKKSKRWGFYIKFPDVDIGIDMNFKEWFICNEVKIETIPVDNWSSIVDVKIFINPTPNEAISMAGNINPEDGLRGLYDEQSGTVFFWDASLAIHANVYDALFNVGLTSDKKGKYLGFYLNPARGPGITGAYFSSARGRDPDIDEHPILSKYHTHGMPVAA